MSDVTIEYDLGRHGWSSFRLSIGVTAVEIGPVGYGTDVLGDFVRAALAVTTGAVHQVVHFDAEPFEWRLVLQRGSATELPGSRLQVRVLTFPDIHAEAANEEGTVVFDASCDVDAFGRAVAVAAAILWARYGADGYNAVWTGMEGFPLRALRALERGLETIEPSGAPILA